MCRGTFTSQTRRLRSQKYPTLRKAESLTDIFTAAPTKARFWRSIKHVPYMCLPGAVCINILGNTTPLAAATSLIRTPSLPPTHAAVNIKLCPRLSITLALVSYKNLSCNPSRNQFKVSKIRCRRATVAPIPGDELQGHLSPIPSPVSCCWLFPIMRCAFKVNGMYFGVPRVCVSFRWRRGINVCLNSTELSR